MPLSTGDGLSESVLRFGVFELDLRRGELRKAGTLVRLPPQPVKLLALFATRPGEVVTRDEIRRRLWESGTVVDFEQGVNHCIREIRSVLEDGARSPRFIETLPRRGYRFIAPVEAGERWPAGVGAPSPAVSATPKGGQVLGLLAGLRRGSIRLIAAARLGAWRARLAVLPFDSLGGSPDEIRLSDGLTDEVTTQLSRGPDDGILHVICRRTARGFKQAPHPVLAARREGVHYLLEGSLRCDGRRARVSAHLVNVRDGTQDWAETYEGLLGDPLFFERDVARAIAAGTRLRLSP